MNCLPDWNRDKKWGNLLRKQIWYLWFYAMADKFLDSVDLEKMKEEIAITRLGQMIWEDGVKAGEERGEIRGKVEGEAAGKSKAYIEMIRDGFISAKDAAIRLGITEDEVKKLLEQF